MNSIEIPAQEKFWSRFAEDFEEKSEYVVGQDIIDAIRSKLLRLKKLGRVLELACGAGTYTKALSKGASSVIASDLSDEMLSVATRNLADCHSVTTEKINCLDIPYKNESFDTVFMANLIHVISDPMRVLQESQRLIVPGGRLVIVSITSERMTLPEKLSLIYRYLRAWGKPPKEGTSFTVSDLSRRIETLGFTIDEAILLGDRMRALFISAVKKRT